VNTSFNVQQRIRTGSFEALSDCLARRNKKGGVFEGGGLFRDSGLLSLAKMALYRALRDSEIKAGCILIPKSQAPFRSLPRFPLVFPVTLGETEEHAVRDHQWNGKFPTRGVSCTTEWSVAVRYAAKNKVVVSIDESKCDSFGIRRFRVRGHVHSKLIIHPEDEEVILVSDNEDGTFPKEIVSEVFQISRS
jgi:hypothetical protein